MKIGIVCFLPQQYNVIVGSCNGNQEILENDLKVFQGKLNSKEIAVACYAGQDYQTLVNLLKDRYNVSHLIFIGTAVSSSSHLKSGDLVVINEAIAKGQEMEQQYQADEKLIDTVFAAIESLEPNFILKTVTGKAISQERELELCLSEGDNSVICIDDRCVAQAQAANRSNMPFAVCNILIQEDELNGEELSLNNTQDILTHIFWLVKGIGERS